MAKLIEDREAVLEAYEDVRSDNTETNWCCLKYNDKTVILDGTGEDYSELWEKFGEEERAYAYVRVETGDEMSVRKKFVLLVWVGPKVSALKKAKLSTDKAFIKQVFSNFAMEMLLDDQKDLKVADIIEKVRKTGGANYGTGK